MTISVASGSDSNTASLNVVALFISDLHLQPDRPATTAAFLAFLDQQASKVSQLYLLGDIFEYWAGDDDLDSAYPQQIALALRKLSNSGVALFWMAGNRDFLVGLDFAAATNATLLDDPHLLTFAHKRYLLTHGDQLCTDDLAYQQFRTQVRQSAWQAAFLARPLSERKAMIAAMRQQSQQHQQAQMQQAAQIMDVNLTAVDALFATSQADIMIHGHTHRPAVHQHDHGVRYVLSDWESDGDSLRGDWLALLEDGSISRMQLPS